MTKTTEPYGRLDIGNGLRDEILPYCRMKSGDIWEDPAGGHRVGVLDATRVDDVKKIFSGEKALLSIQDPPYNVLAGNENTGNLFKWTLQDYMVFSKKWMDNTLKILTDDASLYIWLGADQREHFQPLPDFILMMRNYPGLVSRSLITMRNQRGYGTQKNWMAVRQECLYYIRGNPVFNVEAEYTEIPKILRGYYKKINGHNTENLARSRSETIRAGNVWVDIQQVFYRLQENIPGCYAQKPLRSIERIIKASSNEGDLITDFFTHSGTTLIAGELLNRRVFTFDNDPVFAELSVRRLENFRKTGATGFQYDNPFPEISGLLSRNSKKRANRKSEPTSDKRPITSDYVQRL